MASSSCLSLSHRSSSPRNWIHDVFPSFHGEDVRKDFLGHVLKEFRSKGIYPFIDNEIDRGKSIGPELKQAIRGSKIAIVLVSKNYASSSWCLQELAEIMISRTELGQKVLVVFYKVDPTDVKKQTGDFGEVFKKTCQDKTKEEAETWRQALEGLVTIAEVIGNVSNERSQGKTKEETETWRLALADVATIAGYHSTNWHSETDMIEKIAIDVSNILNNFTLSRDNDRLVGMGTHTKRMEPLLRLDLKDEVRMIGIWGPLGIGKSTLVRFLFDQLFRHFQLSTIMVNIRENYPSPCLDEGSAKLQLQSQMLSKITNHKDMIMINHLGVAQERLKDRKVLLILDDVDQLAQLDALAREKEWFGLGSRIIITTEDRRVLDAHGMSNHIYQMLYPSDESAFQIFCMNAFLQKHPYNGFYELAQQVTKLAGNLPLGLEVLGSSLRGRSKEYWEMVLPGLRTRLDGRIESIFKFSYDALCDEDKDIFLYIACFLNYLTTHKVEVLLGKKFRYVRERLCVLAEKSLISMEYDMIEMHTLLEQFGRETSRKQSLHGPAKHQILVYTEDICEVLNDDTPDGLRVIGIELDLAKIDEDIDINEEALERISNLQFVRIFGDNLAYPGSLESLHGLIGHDKKIRSLHWEHFQSKCLPTNINPKFLVDLVMRGSKLQNLWKGAKPLRNLKWMDLSSSKDLTELPDLSTATSLEELDLQNCSSLKDLPSCIGNLTKLQKLDLNGCSSLLELPSFTENVTSLQILDLGECSSLGELPSSIGNIINLQRLFLNGCSSLMDLPSSIGNLTELQILDLHGCSSLLELASFTENVTSLQILDLSWCSSLGELPSSIGNMINLRQLFLKGCSSLVDLPSSIKNLIDLEELDLSDCSSLVKFPSLGDATKLWKLDFSNCSNLVDIPSLENATNLDLLELTNSSSLEEVPLLVGTATSIYTLDLTGCSSLVKLPSSIGNITYLQEMNLNYCSNLVELPSFIGSLRQLHTLSLIGCEKLQTLPVVINSESLNRLDLTNCSMLKTFPEIATNIKYLSLVGTAIEEVPSSIKLWPHLSELEMSYFENLKNFPHAIDLITGLHLSEDVQEFPSLVKGLPRLSRLILRGCNKLVSLPQLQDSLSYLDASNCKSLERLDFFFHNPKIFLDFANCFNLNQKARDIIIHTSTSGHAILPATEVPAYFHYRATTGGSLTIKLKQRPLLTSMRFKACIMLVNSNDESSDNEYPKEIYTEITERENFLHVPYAPSNPLIHPASTSMLYIFEVEVKEATSTELVFEFRAKNQEWKTRQCGVFQILDVPSSSS